MAHRRNIILALLIACSPKRELPRPSVVIAVPPAPAAIDASAPPPEPHRGSCTLVATSVVSRYGSTATLLTDGRVLLVGSAIHDFEGPWGSVVEIFDPATSALTKVAPTITGRARHSAVLLHDGRVLVAGGLSEDTHSFSRSAEVYDVAKNQWMATSPIANGAIFQALVALPDGRAVFAGGDLMYKGAKLTDALWLDPSTLKWSALPAAPMPRAGRFVTLDDGRLLYVGDSAGWSDQPAPGAEILDLRGGATWTKIPSPLGDEVSVEHVVRVSATRFAFLGLDTSDGGRRDRVALTNPTFGAVDEITLPPKSAPRWDTMFAVDGVLYLRVDASIYRYNDTRRSWSVIATTAADGCTTQLALPGGHGRVLFAGRCSDDIAGALEVCELAP